MRARGCSTWLVMAVVLAALVVPVVAHDTIYKGTVTAVEKARVQIKIVDAAGKVAEEPEWFTVIGKTTVVRGDAKAPFATTELKVGDHVAIVVAEGEEAGTEWTCPMHPDVAKDAAGQCPICSMTLKQRPRPAKASEIRLVAAQ